MYNDFFGFRENPFPVTPDPRIFFSNSIYQRAYANLLYGICERKRVTVLTGEAGTGKTTLLRRLVNNLEHTVHFVFCPYTTLPFPDLVDFICMDFGLSKQSNDCAQQIKLLQQFLIEQQLRGQYAALLLDEAHDLRNEVLIGLARLATLTTGDETLLPIVLAGQEELQQHLTHPDAALLQRQVALACQLDRLKSSEVGPFIYHRLSAVGYEQQELFPPTTVQRITIYAQGIPRSVNIICDNALLIASIQITKVVTPEIIDEVAADLQLTGVRPLPPEQHVSHPVTIPSHSLPAVEPQQLATANMSLFREKNTQWKGLHVSRKRSHVVLWTELAVVAVLFFLLFFRSSPVHNETTPLLNNPSSPSTVAKSTTAFHPQELASREERLRLPVDPQKQAKMLEPSIPPRETPQKEIPQITIATLLKNPTTSDVEWQKKNRDPRRDPFAITSPPSKDQASRTLPLPPSAEASPSLLAMNNAPTSKRTAPPMGTKAFSLAGKQAAYKDPATGPPRGEKAELSSTKPSLIKEEENLTPLMIAAMRGQTTTVRTLLTNGVEVNSKTKNGRTALMLAALAGRSEILQDLINQGAPVNTKNAEGWTALMYAAWNGHTKAVQTLINNGAQVDTKNSDGTTALTQALRNGHHEIARLLRSRQTRPSSTGRSNKSATSMNQSPSSFLVSSSGKRNEGMRTKKQERRDAMLEARD